MSGPPAADENGPALASPRSPRPTAAGLPPRPNVAPGTLPQPMFLEAPQPARPNLGSMLFLTAFFFFMSGNNQMPPQTIQIGPDGEFVPRVTELDMSREHLEEYKGFLNGTSGNWTEPTTPELLPSTILPSKYQHEVARPFFRNITGFYREATLHPVDLILDTRIIPDFFAHSKVPNLNQTLGTGVNNTRGYNETLAKELRGEIDWSRLTKWEMNVKERNVTGASHSLLMNSTEAQSENPTIATTSERSPNLDDWAWVRGTASLSSDGRENETYQTVDYNFYGLHFIPDGTYHLLGVPEGKRVDIRQIPALFANDPERQNMSRSLILGELEKEFKIQNDELLLTDVRPEDYTLTSCSLLIHLTVPQLPWGIDPTAVEEYERELHNPSGIATSLTHPPNYWDGVGLGGVIVAEQCGWAMGLEGGTGVRLDEFWRKSVNYAAFASAAQFLVLILLVRQMESTRTPSTLTKVSLWTIAMMGIADSWIFSAHVVVGVMSDNRTSLPMLVPGFLCLCTAIVFGPRYAVLLHRIQAPERVSTRPAPIRNTIPATISTDTSEDVPTSTAPVAEPSRSVFGTILNYIQDHPGLQWTVGLISLFLIFQVVFLPSIVPFFLFILYSFWLPQIWRNARRGNSHSLQYRFMIGTSIGRLALPLYAFGCPDNVFFIQNKPWVWSLAAWQGVQILFLFAQDRFGPAFFLPKSYAPVESYNYHPTLPTVDAENPEKGGDDEKTCSICMEEVDTRPGPSSEVLLGMNPRRAYALAPCHHLFHTKCLAQWLAIKTICPLCKRSLPPL